MINRLIAWLVAHTSGGQGFIRTVVRWGPISVRAERLVGLPLYAMVRWRLPRGRSITASFIDKSPPNRNVVSVVALLVPSTTVVPSTTDVPAPQGEPWDPSR